MLAHEPWASSKVCTVEEIIPPEAFLQEDGNEKQLEHFIEAIKVEEQAAIVEVSKMTIGQRNNPAWHLVRKGRLTASNFGCVLKAKRATPSLVKRLLGKYNLSGVKAIEWGVNNEGEAVSAFTRQNGLQVVETGIWLDSCGVIGASPDGLVGNDHVLEMKCPFTQRNSSIDEALKDKNFWLEEGKDGSLCLKKKPRLLASGSGTDVFDQEKTLLFCCLDYQTSSYFEHCERWKLGGQPWHSPRFLFFSHFS